MRTQNAARTVQEGPCVLHVCVNNSIREHVDQPVRLQALPDQVTGIEVESEGRMMVDRFKCMLRGDQVVGNLCWMHFQRKADADIRKDVQNGQPTLCEVVVSRLHMFRRCWRKEVQVRPDARTGKAVHNRYAQLRSGPRRVFHGLSCPLTDAFGIAVAPDCTGQNGLVPIVDTIAYRLADQMTRHGPRLEPVVGQQFMATLAVGVVGQRLGHIEMIAPAGQLKPVEAELCSLRGHGLQWQISPLAGEQRDWSGHGADATKPTTVGSLVPGRASRRAAVGCYCAPMHVLGLDIGTGGARCLVLRVDDGTIVGDAVTAVDLHHPHPGWSQQNPEDWWQAACNTIQSALAKADLKGDDIAAIALTGQMHGCTLIDESDAPVGPAILWNDQRSGAQCAAMLDVLDRERWVQLTGKPPLPGLTLPSLQWMRDEQPEGFQKARHLLLPKDFLRLKLTGKYATDAGDASGTMLLDVRERSWSAEICSLVDLDASLLPTVHESTDMTGGICSSGAAATGLCKGTPVIAGGGDQQAGGVGCGIVSPGTVSLNLGTSGVLFAATSQPPDTLPRGLHLFCHATSSLWHVMGVMLSAGGSLRWWRDISGVDYDTLVEHAATDSDGVCFRPYLSGERTPHEDPDLRAGFSGLRLHHNRDVLTRAVLEGIAFGLRDGLALIRSQQQVDHLRFTGAAASNPLWRQLIADVMNCTVATIQADQGSAFGACVLAAVGAGAYADVESACIALVRETSLTTPSEAARMDEAYARWSD